MLGMFARQWRVIAIRGVIAVIFGVLTLVWPLLTLQRLILLFGAYTLVDGFMAVVTGLTSYGEGRWWAVLLHGIVGVLIGIFVFLQPGTTAIILLYFIAAWAIIVGILQIVAAIQLRRIIQGEWVMLLCGIASIIFGFILIVFPGVGALSLVWLIGAYSIFFGILLFVPAFRLRGMLGQTLVNDVSSSGQTGKTL